MARTIAVTTARTQTENTMSTMSEVSSIVFLPDSVLKPTEFSPSGCTATEILGSYDYFSEGGWALGVGIFSVGSTGVEYCLLQDPTLIKVNWE